MQRLFRLFHRWWLEHSIRQRTDHIQQYRQQIARFEGSPGELLAEIGHLRDENLRDAKKVMELLK